MTLKNDQGIDIYDCDGTVTRYPTRTRTYAVYPLPLAIRRRQILPSPDRPDEQRWSVDGIRPIPELDTVRAG